MSATTNQSKTSNSSGNSKPSNIKSSPSSENHQLKPSSSSEEGPFIQKTRKKRNNKGQNRDVPPQVPLKPNLVQTPRSTPSIPEQSPASTTVTNTTQPTNSNLQSNNASNSRPVSTYGVRGNNQHPGGHYKFHNQAQNNGGRSTPQRYQTREWTNSMSRKSSLSDLSINSTGSNPGGSTASSRPIAKPISSQVGLQPEPEVQRLTLSERPSTPSGGRSTPSGSQTSRSHSSWASVLKPGLIEVPDGLKADVFGTSEITEPVEEPTVSAKRPSTGNNHKVPHHQSYNEVQQNRVPSFNGGQSTNALPPSNLRSGTSLLGDVPAHLIPTGMQFRGPPQEQKGRNSRPNTGSQNMRAQNSNGRNKFPQNGVVAQRQNNDRKSRRQSKPTMDSQPSYEPQAKKRSNEPLPNSAVPFLPVESQQEQPEQSNPVAPEKNIVEKMEENGCFAEELSNSFDAEKPQQESTGSNDSTDAAPVEEMVVEPEPTPADNSVTETPRETAPEKTEPDVHLLETPWTMYHMNQTTKKKGSDWNSGMQPVGVFDTVEAFFHGYHTTPKTSETGKMQDYMFFRGGKGKFKEWPVIGAAWEDPKNTDGGLWRFNLPVPRGNTAAPVVDFFWKEILMALVGEQFGDHNEMVNGCYFCNRGDEYRVQVWMGCNDPEPVTAIGVRLAELLDLRENFYFDYCSHREIHQKGNRYAKPLHENKEILRMLAAKRNSASSST